MSIGRISLVSVLLLAFVVGPLGDIKVMAADCPGGEISSGDIVDPTESPPANPSPLLSVPKAALNFVDTSKDLKVRTATVSFQRIGKITMEDGTVYHLFTSPYEYLLNSGSDQYGFIPPGGILYNAQLPRETFLKLANASGSTAGIDIGSSGPIFLSLMRGGVALLGGTPVVGWGVVAISAGVQRVQNVPISAYELAVITKSVYGFYLFLPDAALTGSNTQLSAQIRLMQTYRDFEAPTSTGAADAVYEKILAFVSPSQAGVQVGTKFSYPDTSTLKDANCTIKISTELSSQMKASYASWRGNDVNAANAVAPATSQDSVNVCGTPSLKTIINFALCTVLDTILSFLKSLV